MTKFNILGVEAATNSYDPLPRGRYHLVIAATTFAPSKQGNPKISVEYEVVDGEFAGRKLFDNLTLTEAALPFLRAKLEGIMGDAAFAKWAAKGVDKGMLQRLADGGKLCGIHLVGNVRIRKNKETGDGQNVVESVVPYEEVEEEEEAEYA